MFRSAVTLSLAAVAMPAGAQALELVASRPLADIDVTTAGVQQIVDFSGVTEPIAGFGLDAQFTVVQGDIGGGTGPWSLDVSLQAQSPAGSSAVFTPIGGDVTIADYPLADGAAGFAPATNGDGNWTFTFDTTASPTNWTYGLRDLSVHLLADAPPVTQTFTATPDAMNLWDRPFFIEGVSGLGPVRYTAFEFEVSTSGVYDMTSVLSTGGDHFTFLYKDSFDPAQPLANLHDYGLGNGNSPFGITRGTSNIKQLLFEGTTYVWVTSTWASFSPIAPCENTIVGPGDALAPNPCPADTNGDGLVTPQDFSAWVQAFNAQAPACDQNGDSLCTPQDFSAWVQNYNAGCS